MILPLQVAISSERSDLERKLRLAQEESLVGEIGKADQERQQARDRQEKVSQRLAGFANHIPHRQLNVAGLRL